MNASLAWRSSFVQENFDVLLGGHLPSVVDLARATSSSQTGCALVEVQRTDLFLVNLRSRRLLFGMTEDSVEDSVVQTSVFVGWVLRTSDCRRDVPACVHQVCFAAEVAVGELAGRV